MPPSDLSAVEPNPSVQISQHGAVGVVTLNRPARFNAITIPMMLIPAYMYRHDELYRRSRNSGIVSTLPRM